MEIHSAYVPTLPFCKDGSRSPVSPSNVSFCDYPGLNVRLLWTFQVDHTFYKLDVKIVAASNEIRFVRCSRLTSYHEHELLSHKRKKCQEWVWESIQFVIFSAIKSAIKLNRLLLEFLMLSNIDIQESSREDNAKFIFIGITSESKRSWRVHFKIYIPFWATWRLEHMRLHHCHL